MIKITPLICVIISIATSNCFSMFNNEITVDSINGPAHASWGSTIELNIHILNKTSYDLPEGELAAILSRRSTEQTKSKIINTTDLRRLSAGAGRSVSINITLPNAPSISGIDDGDYDIKWIYRNGEKKITEISGIHPIHIETRDRYGRIDGKYSPRIYDFLSANSTPARTVPDWLTETGIRNSREDAAWNEFEPADNVWNSSAFGPKSRFGSLILQARKYNMTILPILCGIPEWAQIRGDDGKPKGGWGPPADPERWSAFIDKIVDFYSKPPYLQQDWQIWNEAQMGLVFWTGDSMEQFIKSVYIPAAKAIRNHYADLNDNGKEDEGERCRVVYGGYPCSNWNDGSYAKILNIDKCGEYTDFLDAHYMQGLKWFEIMELSGDVYSEWVHTGKSLGCWQTEEGDAFAIDPAWFHFVFFPDVEWALNHNWDHKDKFREYFFHYYMAQPNQGFFWDNKRKWPNGYSIGTFFDLLKGDLSLPGSGRNIKAEEISDTGETKQIETNSLIAGGRIVIQFKLNDYEASGKSLFSISLKSGEKVKSVKRKTFVKGMEYSIDFTEKNRKLLFIQEWRKTAKNEEDIDNILSPYCYMIIELDKPAKTWD